jgi:pimeloyl-ACP methyl ester carboxylesterase
VVVARHRRLRARDLDRLLAAGRCCIESYTGTLLEDSAAIEVPKWMVWGRHDGLVPAEHAAAYARVHPDASVHVFDDCGHYPHIELPSRFNRLLHGWMAESAAVRPAAVRPVRAA